MRLNTSINYRNAFYGIIGELFRRCRTYHWDHDKLLERRSTELFDHPAWSKVPRWVQSYAMGYEKAHWDSLWSRDIHWRVRLDDKLILGSDVPEGEWHRVTVGAFVWNDAPDIIFSDGRDST